MAYEWGPYLTANFLDKYFDFSSARYDKVKATIATDFEKNKPLVKKNFTQALDLLSAMSDKKELSEAEIDSLIQNLRNIQAETVSQFKPSISEVVINMTKDELVSLKEGVAENHQKFLKTLDKKDEYKKKQLKSFHKNMEFVFDTVSDEQEKMYSEFIDQNYDYYKAHFEFRKGEMARLESLFANKEAMLAEALKYYSNEDSIKNKEFLEKQNAFFKNVNTFVKRIWSTLSEKQRAEFRKTLSELKTEITKIK